LKRRNVVAGAVMFLLVALFAWSALATDGELYFSSDSRGQNRVTNVQEGDSVFIVVYDPDENIDCDVRDKFWTDIKVMDPKTGAYIVWVSYKWPRAGMDVLIDPPFGDADGILYNEMEYVPYKGHWPGNSAGSLAFDFMEETGADTGLFVSHRAFQVGTRVNYNDPVANTHVVDDSIHGIVAWEEEGLSGIPYDFQGGNWGYWFGAGRGALYTTAAGADADSDDLEFFVFDSMDPVAAWGIIRSMRDTFAVLPPPWYEPQDPGIDKIDTQYMYVLGRFENMDTLTGLYQDQNDPTDVALGLMKIIDTEATITWDNEIYKDANTAAKITVTDPDENLNCNEIEYVPVFIIVNPGSWNPVQTESIDGEVMYSPTNFCSLKMTGGVVPGDVQTRGALCENYKADVYIDYPFDGESIRWYNIYDSGIDEYLGGGPIDLGNHQPQEEGSYYMQYAVAGSTDAWGDANVNVFDTENCAGLARVMFFAQETEVNSGIFELNLNSILDDLGFNSLNVRDVLVAYYLDPNDEDDFKLAVSYIEERMHSITSFTDASRMDKSIYWLGRDPVYVQVIDSNANTDPCCPEQVVVHVCDPHNEDDVEWLILDEQGAGNSSVFFTNGGTVLRPVWDAMGIGEAVPALFGLGGFQLWFDNWKVEAYNEDDIYARYNDVYYTDDEDGMLGIGDANPFTAMPPRIDRVRVANDVSFDLMSIADTQVYDGSATKMYFLDRQGNRVSGYVNSDCVFVEVIDPDQDEDQYRRERVDAFWDGGQNLPFGPFALNPWECLYEQEYTHPVNALLGDTNIFNNGTYAMLYVLNPRNGRWAGIDIMETGVATGDFVSVICIDLVSVYTCVPTLGVLPGDTVLAMYQDPSNHSDSAWISIKVGVGGGGTPPGQASKTDFVNATGTVVASYTDADSVYVKVKDPSRAGATVLQDAVKIGTVTFDVTPLAGATTDTFITAAITLSEIGAEAGDTITATYVDPMDPSDTSWDTITIVASELNVEEFIATPNPFSTEVAFGYVGSGIATEFEVAVYDLSGHVVWSETKANVTEVVWDGKNEAGASLANGGYIYVVMATDGTNTFTGKGTVFINR